MAITTKSRASKSAKSKSSRYIGKPAGIIQQRVETAGPSRFGIIVHLVPPVKYAILANMRYWRRVLRTAGDNVDWNGRFALANLIQIDQSEVRECQNSITFIPARDNAATVSTTTKWAKDCSPR